MQSRYLHHTCDTNKTYKFTKLARNRISNDIMIEAAQSPTPTSYVFTNKLYIHELLIRHGFFFHVGIVGNIFIFISNR